MRPMHFTLEARALKVQGRLGVCRPLQPDSFGNGLRPEERWGRRLGAAQAWGANLAPQRPGKNMSE